MLISIDAHRSTHIGYCFNVLPGETAQSLIEQTRRFCAPLRARLGVDQLGVGLWIAATAAQELRENTELRAEFRSALDEAQLYVYTLNGFPYGGFHAARVKQRVFEPSWADPARRAYTESLADLLAELLRDDITRASISTVPLGPAHVDRSEAARNIEATVSHLQAVQERTGKTISISFEPEPGAAFERADQMAAFLAGVGASRHAGICFDTCHAAVVGENPDEAFQAMARAGVACQKVQISSALVANNPSDAQERAALATFDEPRFLHQVRTPSGQGAMDLGPALTDLTRAEPWRIHFHVPIHHTNLDRFETTSKQIPHALEAAFRGPGAIPHLEVETYTWGVLPEAQRPTTDNQLIDGIAKELEWACQCVEGLAKRTS